jgi:hypothetical protein
MSDKINEVTRGFGRLFSDRLVLFFILASLFLLHWIFLYGKFPAGTLIIYPFVYLISLVLRQAFGKGVLPLEMWIATNSTWFITVMNRLAIPFAVVIFGILVWHGRKTIWGWWSAILLCLMWVATALYQST